MGRRLRARMSSDCRNLLRCALLRAFWPVGALAMARMRSGSVSPLVLARSDSILLARGAVRSISGTLFDRFSSVSAARALAQRKRRDMRFDCAGVVATHVGRPARGAEIAENRAEIVPGAARDGACDRNARKGRFDSSRACVSASPGRFGAAWGGLGKVLGRIRSAWGMLLACPGASRECPGSSRARPIAVLSSHVLSVQEKPCFSSAHQRFVQ